MLEFITSRLWPASKSVPSQPGRPENAAAAGDLRDSEEQFARLVEGIRDYAAFLLDAQGHVRTWNAGAERIKGYRKEEIVGRHFSTFYPAEAIATGWPAHELEVAGETGRFEDEGWRLRKDGTRFWANVVITALRDDDGQVRGFLKLTRDMTDRRQAEEKLRLSEERFRLLIDGVRDYAIFMLDPAGRVTTWNAGAERLKGYTAQEIIGQHFSRFYPADVRDRGWPEEELRRATADGRLEDEGWRVRRDGSQFWANVVITALRDERGVLLGFAKVTRDLTQRRQAEENQRRLLQEEAARAAIQESAREAERQREQLHVTLTSIGDAVIVTDQSGNVTFMNPVASQLTGWNLADAAGQPLETVFPIINERTRRPVENPATKVFREGTIVGLANHTLLISKDLREIPIDDSGAPIRDAEGRIVGVVLVFRDVTEARRAIDARLHLATIVESSDDAIISEDVNCVITSWNRGAERLYGYAPEDAIGKNIAFLAPPELVSELAAISQRVRQGERIEHYETQRLRQDGRRIEVSMTVSPICNSEGEVIGASKIARDITAKRQEERYQNEFLAMLSHELRNPLAPIRAGLELLALNGVDDENVSVMREQVNQLVRLVDDLLDAARITQGKVQLRTASIDLTALARTAVEAIRPIAEQHRQELSLSLPASPVWVEADAVRMGQVFSNLLNNACKYTPAGGHIRLTVSSEGCEAVVRVRDDGIGIDAELLPNVFKLFTQADRSLERSEGGLGIGLTLVKTLVELHGGSVTAHSEGLGRGSEFVLRLPERRQAAVVPTEDEGDEDSPPRRVLIVDDNVGSTHILSRLFAKLGDHEIRTAHDGPSAIEAAAEFAPDVILLDIGLPRLNGYEVARHLRAQPRFRETVLVALTGYGSEDDQRRSIESGFDLHVVKPASLAALKRVLKLRAPDGSGSAEVGTR